MRRVKLVARVQKSETEVRSSVPGYSAKRSEWPRFGEVSEPAVDIYERDDEFIIEVELPGVSEKDISLLLYPNRLEIKGVKKEKLPKERFSFFRMEREFGPFFQEIIIPGEVDPDHTGAFMERGILTVKLKKPASKKKDKK